MSAPADNGSAVCVVGVGAATAVGRTAPATATAVRAGIARFFEHPYMIDKAGDPMVVARARYLNDETEGGERFGELALPPAREAMSVLNGSAGSAGPIPVVIGLPAQRPGLPAGTESLVAERIGHSLRDMARLSDVETIATGHSAGLMALEAARRRISEGSATFCLIGGVDSYMEPETLEWLDNRDKLQAAANDWGFIPGEAAGFCLLCSQDAAERYGLAVLVRVVAAATAHEKNLIDTETVCIGEGLSEAVGKVLEALPSPEVRIDDTICGMSGDPYHGDEFAFTIARMSERFVDAGEFQTPAECWGDVGAASGPLFVTLAAAAGRKNYAKGPRTLLWTSSDGGERTAAILEVHWQPRRAGSWV